MLVIGKGKCLMLGNSDLIMTDICTVMIFYLNGTKPVANRKVRLQNNLHPILCNNQKSR